MNLLKSRKITSGGTFLLYGLTDMNIRYVFLLFFSLSTTLLLGKKQSFYDCRENGFFFSADGKLWTEDAFFTGKKCFQFHEDGSVVTVTAADGKYSLDRSLSTLSPYLLEANKVSDDKLKEASGLAASGISKNVYWSHNDSGDSAVVFAVGSKGEALGRFVLKDCLPVDIEDIAVGAGPKPGISYIYLADIGDNTGKRKVKKIYRFAEPKISDVKKWQLLADYDVISFQYPDKKKYDAETILLDPFTKDLIVITKRGRKSKELFDHSFILPYPQKSDGKMSEVKKSTDIEIPAGLFIGYGITGGDISRDGRQLVLKTYTNIYYWQKAVSQSFADFFKEKYTILPYNTQEGQGEAVCFSGDGNYFLTIPEESLGEAYLSLYLLKKWKKK